jgi:hypothetical protein
MHAQIQQDQSEAPPINDMQGLEGKKFGKILEQFPLQHLDLKHIPQSIVFYALVAIVYLPFSLSLTLSYIWGIFVGSIGTYLGIGVGRAAVV